MKIKKGDKVKIIAGKDKGKEGKVILVDAKKNKVIVEGINMVKKAVKPSPANPQSGIVSQEAPIDASNVMYLNSGVATRIGYSVKTIEGKKVKTRIAKSTGESID
jgi:large subunit ribosomal protein L24